MIFAGWRLELLGGMGIAVTHERLRLLGAWALAEGGMARFNPLNTTMKLNGTTEYNRAGVRNYSDAVQGIAATMLTLRLPFYDDLVTAMRTDGLTAEAMVARGSRALDTWGTGHRAVAAALRRV